MSTLEKSHDVDLEAADRNDGGVEGGVRGHVPAGNEGGGRPLFPDAATEIVENGSTNNKPKEDGRNSNASECSVVIHKSNVSECSVDVGDLESGIPEKKLHLAKNERDCRICHLSMDAANQDSGIPIELGCSCKDDLAAAHKQCAEAWFKIKGNKTCEICGSIATNVVGVPETELMEQWNEANDAAPSAMASARVSESRNFWHGHRFLNFLLACMVFAFVISWLFHFNVPS